MVAALLLVVLGVAARVFASTYQLWNLAPMGALSLYAGARVPKRFAWIVPLAAMVISDILLDGNRSRAWFEPIRISIYGTYMATAFLGLLANRKNGKLWLPVLSLGGSTLFFLTTNFAVWADGRMYPLSFTGLVACYYAGLPYYARTVIGDLIGTAVLFTLGPVLERAFARKPAVEAASASE